MSYLEDIKNASKIGEVLYELRDNNIVDIPISTLIDQYVKAKGYTEEQQKRICEEISDGVLSAINDIYTKKGRKGICANEAVKLSCQTCIYHKFRDPEYQKNCNNFVWWNNLCTKEGRGTEISWDGGTVEREYPFCRTFNPDGLCEWHSKRVYATKDDELIEI